MCKTVTVEIIKESLAKLNGRFSHCGIKQAMDGEKKGIWRIVSDKTSEEYATKVMDAVEPEGYLAKTGFKGLSSTDVSGGKK